MSSTPDDSRVTMDTIVSLAKRRGFVFPGSEIYGGLAGMWDYGPLGLALRNNIRSLWWKMFVDGRSDMYGIEAALIMPRVLLEASGHVATFTDPMAECKKCRHRFRADQIDGATCPDCGSELGEVRNFNLMFQTQVGAVEDSSSVAYLRPETAQGIFSNFKNVMDSFHPKLPFGIAQIGKAFRNEITPRDFIFRVRELEQMEIEYFVRPDEWQEPFEEWRAHMTLFIQAIGLPLDKVHELEVADGDRAHYSKRTIDFEFDYPFGRKELYGLAYRTDYDLKKHREASGVPLEYYDEETKERFIPHVVEPSFGLERSMLAVMLSAYTEDELGGEARTYLKFEPRIAPVKVAVFPLLKNKPALVEKASEVFIQLKKEIPGIVFDDNGNIGKRYRRQDEIGTPFCVTIDFETLGDEKGEHSADSGSASGGKDTVTLRDRDTGAQERVKISELAGIIKARIQ